MIYLIYSVSIYLCRICCVRCYFVKYKCFIILICSMCLWLIVFKYETGNTNYNNRPLWINRFIDLSHFPNHSLATDPYSHTYSHTHYHSLSAIRADWFVNLNLIYVWFSRISKTCSSFATIARVEELIDVYNNFVRTRVADYWWLWESRSFG